MRERSVLLEAVASKMEAGRMTAAKGRRRTVRGEQGSGAVGLSGVRTIT